MNVSTSKKTKRDTSREHQKGNYKRAKWGISKDNRRGQGEGKELEERERRGSDPRENGESLDNNSNRKK